LDDDTSGDAVLDDDAPDMEHDHDDELTEDSSDLVELDPAEEDTPLSAPGPRLLLGRLSTQLLQRPHMRPRGRRCWSG